MKAIESLRPPLQSPPLTVRNVALGGVQRGRSCHGIGTAGRKSGHAVLPASLFSRIKERNAKRLEDCIRSGKVQVMFSSIPVEFRPATVVLDVAGSRREIANDCVWILPEALPRMIY